MDYLMTALGGAIGSMGRYGISQIPYKGEFPLLTLITNILGAVLIGVITGLASERPGISKETVLFWKTGVCGGFTTFSTFSLEAFNLLEKKSYIIGSIYIILSTGSCLLGILIGRKLSMMVTQR